MTSFEPKGPDGFLLVDKPRGWTSHDVVARVRSLFALRKVGHSGTLDPLASGLLVLGLGRSTRLLRFVQQLAKEYLASAAFGVATDTLDAEGAILSRDPMPFTAGELQTVMQRFVGTTFQVPPMVSARKIEGRRLYELAREGREVDREARPVQIYELELTDFAPSDYPEATFRVVCSTGTYVRTLADDIARALGGRAHVIDLRRTRVGSLSVDEANTMEAVSAASTGELEELMLSPAQGLIDLTALHVDEPLAEAVSHGATLHGSAVPVDFAAGTLVRVLGPGGRLLGVYRAQPGRAIPEVVTA